MSERRDLPLAWRIAALAGIPALVWANYYLRHTLEDSDRIIKPFLSVYYPDGVKALFAPDYPWWRMLLPMREIGGSWTTTSLLLTHWVEMKIGAPETWYLFNALVIVVSYAISWAAFRSRAFSYTFAICMGFSTHLYHTYAAPGTVSFGLLTIYYEFLLFSAWQVIRGSRPMLWRPLFVVATIVTALAYEGWLDLFVFTCLAAVVVGYVSVRHGRREWRAGLAFCMVVLVVTAASYVLLKTRLGYGQQIGSESDVVFNYPAWSPAVEDVLSRMISNTHLAVTNFLPPMFVSSTAFYQLGGAELASYQGGYHQGFSYLIPMQAMFFWRYWAGVVFALVLVALVIALTRLHRHESRDALVVALLLLMILTGGPTHAIVKARPMTSMPLLGYHVMVGVIGMSLLLAFGAMVARRYLPNVLTWSLTVVAIWAVVFYSALVRPAFLEHEAAQVGFGPDIYPDPMEALAKMRGLDYRRPRGSESYKLTPDDLTAWQERISDLLLPLPDAAPALENWRAEAGVTLVRSNQGYYVEGNDSSWGYQLTSPPIPVPPHRQVAMRWKGRIDQGDVCLGVLDENALWIVPADGVRPEAVFDSGKNTHVYAVLANCNPFPTGNPRSRFAVQSITYGTFASLAPAGPAQ